MSSARYNIRSMKKYGWDPHDLGLDSATANSAIITAVVKVFQAKYDLVEDGKMGPITVRRLIAEKAFKQDELSGEGSLLVDGQIIEVPFKAVNPTEADGLSLIGHGDYRRRKKQPSLVVWHWDVCLSATSCHRVLSKRGLSSHGCIDNDGTFYQFLDLHRHRGWHAGGPSNRTSIGIDVSNGVYEKYQPYYTKRWGPRPEITAVTNGSKKSLLGYYPAQVETARGIAKFLNEHMGILLCTPEEPNVIESPEKFKGHIAHYHITRRKWDVAGFPFNYVIGKEDNYDA